MQPPIVTCTITVQEIDNSTSATYSSAMNTMASPSEIGYVVGTVLQKHYGNQHDYTMPVQAAIHALEVSVREEVDDELKAMASKDGAHPADVIMWQMVQLAAKWRIAMEADRDTTPSR